jgi:hypothetical protein
MNLGPAQLRIQWVLRYLSLKVKFPVCKISFSFSSSDNFWNKWNYSFTVQSGLITLCLTRHNGKKFAVTTLPKILVDHSSLRMWMALLLTACHVMGTQPHLRTSLWNGLYEGTAHTYIGQKRKHECNRSLLIYFPFPACVRRLTFPR